jgi:hypothetical protein
MAKVIQVIEVELLRGKGTEDSVMRGVTQYWSLDGELLAENDPLATDRPSPIIERGAQLLKDLKAPARPVSTFTAV